MHVQDIVLKINIDVKSFQLGLSDVDRDSFSWGMLSHFFPKNCCEGLSMMLARFLIEERGYDQSDIFMVKGERLDIGENSGCHLWLVVNGVIVDITLGQFSDAPKNEVISMQSTWHKSFDLLDKTAANSTFKFYVSAYNEQIIDKDYHLIIKKICNTR